MEDQKIPEKYANRAAEFQKFLDDVREKQKLDREATKLEIEKEMIELRKSEMEHMKKIQEELKRKDEFHRKSTDLAELTQKDLHIIQRPHERERKALSSATINTMEKFEEPGAWTEKTNSEPCNLWNEEQNDWSYDSILAERGQIKNNENDWNNSFIAGPVVSSYNQKWDIQNEIKMDEIMIDIQNQHKAFTQHLLIALERFRKPYEYDEQDLHVCRTTLEKTSRSIKNFCKKEFLRAQNCQSRNANVSSTLHHLLMIESRALLFRLKITSRLLGDLIFVENVSEETIRRRELNNDQREFHLKRIKERIKEMEDIFHKVQSLLEEDSCQRRNELNEKLTRMAFLIFSYQCSCEELNVDVEESIEMDEPNILDHIFETMVILGTLSEDY